MEAEIKLMCEERARIAGKKYGLKEKYWAISPLEPSQESASVLLDFLDLCSPEL